MAKQATAVGICYSLADVNRFFRSVAVAMAFQRHTKIKWVEYKDSAVLNAIYGVLFWKEGPGTVEVQQSTMAEIKRTIDQLNQEFLTIWIDRLHTQGPAVASQYVRRMEQIRDQARAATQEMYRDAGEINRQIIEGVDEGIKNLARIKLASQVGVAVIGAAGVIVVAGGATLMVGGATLTAGQATAAITGIQLTNSFALSMAKNWGASSQAKAVSIDMGKELGKVGAGEVLGAGADAMTKKAAQQIGHSEQIIRSAQGQITKYSKVLAQEGLRKARYRKATNIIQGSRNQIAQQTGNIAKSTTRQVAGGILSKALPVVFAAWDIKDAYSDYKDTTKGLGR